MEFGLEETKSTIQDFSYHLSKARVIFIFLFGAFVVISILSWFALFPPENSPLALDYEHKIGDVIAPILVLSISILVIFGTITSLLMYKSWKKQKQLTAIQSHLRRRSYLTNFELVEPEIRIEKGDQRFEKIMNHLSYVFPDIKKINEKRIKRKKTPENWRLKRWPHILRKYDLPILTNMGAYVVQFLVGTVKFEDVEEIVKGFSYQNWYDYILGRPNIQRLIIVGLNFEDGFGGGIEEKMNLMKKHFFVDIIHEEDFGYSVLWID